MQDRRGASEPQRRMQDRRGASEPQRRMQQLVLWQPQQWEDCTDGQRHHPALPSLRHMSASAGGCWNLAFGDQTWGEDWGWLCRNSPGALKSTATAPEGVHGGSLRGQAPLFGGRTRGGAGPSIVAFFPVCALRGQDTACTGSRSSSKPPPAQTPGAVTKPLPPPSWTTGVVVSYLRSHHVLQG